MNLDALYSELTLKTKAKLALWANSGIRTNAVKIDTSEGSVTLFGKVDSASQKKEANDLVVGIDEAANASTPHLVGHPTNIVISHWISASGYRNSGSDTYYADSVHGTSFWSWSKNVPAFSWLPSGNTGMSYLMRLSGYIG